MTRRERREDIALAALAVLCVAGILALRWFT